MNAIVNDTTTPGARRAQRRLSTALWVTNLASVIASNLSYLYLASLVYRSTGVIEYANAVLMCPMIIPVLACVAMTTLTRRVSPRRLFIGANVTALACAAGLALSLHAAPLLALAGAALIGFADALQRVTRIVAIKLFFPEGDVKFAVPVALSAQFAAGGLSGVLMAVAPHEASPPFMLGVIGCLFTLAAAASLFLPKSAVRPAATAAPHGGGLRAFISALAQRPPFRSTFLRAVAFVGVFQGFYNLSRVALPAHLLHLSDRFVGLLQMLSSVSMIVGAVLFYTCGRRGVAGGAQSEAALIGVCVAAATAAVSVAHPAASFVLYCVFVVAFEFLFLRAQADLVEACPQEIVGTMAAYQYAAMYSAMLLVMAAGNAVQASLHLHGIALGCGLLYLVLRMAISFDGRRMAVNSPRAD
jgi:hypothetical protein